MMKLIFLIFISALVINGCGEKTKSETIRTDSGKAKGETHEKPKPGPLSEVGNVNLERVIYYEEIDQLSETELRVLRNEIFARKGYQFKSRDLQDYFKKYDWYVPIIADADQLALDSVEIKNVELIRSVENQYRGPIAFVRNRGVYVHNQKRLRKVVDGWDPALSPGGGSLAYTVSSEGTREIAIHNLMTGDTRSFKINDGNYHSPVWSSDGNYIAFQIMRNAWTVGIYDLSRDTFLTFEHSKYLFSPTWAYDSDGVYCHDMSHLYRFDLQGSKKDSIDIEKIISFDQYGIGSSTSFYFIDEKIVFTAGIYEEKSPQSIHEPMSAIFVFDRRTSKLSRLTPKGLFASGLWVDKKGQILFFAFSDDSEDPDIYVSNLNASFVKKVIIPTGADLPAKARLGEERSVTHLCLGTTGK